MKTKFKLLVLPAIVLSATVVASCSQDDIVNMVTQERPISFQSDITSRARATTTANLNEIWVYAETQGEDGVESEVTISGDTFYKDEASQMFISAKDYYWPKTGTVNFFALNLTPEIMGEIYNELPEGYANEPFDASLETKPETFFTVVNSEQLLLYNYGTPGDVNKQSDIVIATASGTKEKDEKTGLTLNFNHALSQIVIKAKCIRNDGYEVTACNTAVAGVAETGTLSVKSSGMEWGMRYRSGGMMCYSIGLDKKLDSSSKIINDTPYMLIPDNLQAWDVKNDKTNTDKLAYLVLNVKITKDGKQVYPDQENWTDDEIAARIYSGEYGRVAIPFEINWESGKKYIYTVDFSDGFGYYLPSDPTKPGEPILGNPIKISSVEVEEWVDGDDLSVEA